MSTIRFIGSVHTYPDFLNLQLFLSGQKFPRPHVSVFKSNLPVHTWPTRVWIHSSTQDSSGNIGNRACVVKRTKFSCILQDASTGKREKTWERGCHLEYSIHGKELGSILLRHRKKSRFRVPRFRIHSVSKNFHSGERIQKAADSYAGFTWYVWTEVVSGKK